MWRWCKTTVYPIWAFLFLYVCFESYARAKSCIHRDAVKYCACLLRVQNIDEWGVVWCGVRILAVYMLIHSHFLYCVTCYWAIVYDCYAKHHSWCNCCWILCFCSSSLHFCPLRGSAVDRHILPVLNVHSPFLCSIAVIEDNCPMVFQYFIFSN